MLRFLLPALAPLLVVPPGPAACPQRATRWPDVAGLRAELATAGLDGAYDELRGRLGQAARWDRADRRAPAFAELMSDPLGAPGLAIQWTDEVLAAADDAARPGLGAVLRQAARLRGLDADGLPDGAGVEAPRGLEAKLDVAAACLQRAAEAMETALRAVPAERRDELRREAITALRAFTATVYVMAEPERQRAWDELMRHVGQADLVRAAAEVAPLLQPEFWRTARADARRYDGPAPAALEGISGTLVATRETPLGWIVVGDRRANTYDGVLDTALIVDVGGDDTYAARCSHGGEGGRPVAVVIDLRGDDVHGSAGPSDEPGTHSEYGGPASGLLGVGAILDVEGDDTHLGGSLALGAGMLGAGLLVDAEGADSYAADAFCQGAGVLGVGLCWDLDGADTMVARLFAQGFGGPQGYGLLLDAGGDDRRTATGKYPSSYGTAGEFNGMSQGAAAGWRVLRGEGPRVAGGFGLLVDGGGDDVSRVGEFGYGMGYFLGTGIVRDAGGDDRVDASRYGIATGAHQACGLVLDDGGDDIYVNPHTASVAGNWDYVVSVLVDAAGDDLYEGGGITTGSATITSFAALVDGGGADAYRSAAGATAFGSCGHALDVRNGSRCVALFADLGGGEDTYPGGGLEPPPANGLVAVRRKEDTHEGRRAESGVGVFVDR